MRIFYISCGFLHSALWQTQSLFHIELRQIIPYIIISQFLNIVNYNFYFLHCNFCTNYTITF